MPNDTTILQAKIERAHRAGGGTIMIDRDYECRKLSLPQGSKIVFRSDNGATLRLADGTNSPIIEGVDVEHFGMNGVTIDGNSANQGNTNASTVSVFASTVRVRGCTFLRGQNGVLSLRHVRQRAEIVGNTFREGREHPGIANEGTAYIGITSAAPHRETSDEQFVTIRDNLLIGGPVSKPSSGDMRGCGGIICSGNRALEPTKSHRLTIVGNTIVRCGQDTGGNHIAAIHLYRRAGYTLISGNRILDSYHDGIRVQASPHTIVCNNTIAGAHEQNVGKPSISIDSREGAISEGCLVRGNLIERWRNGTAISAVYPSDLPGRDLTIDGNLVRNVDRFVHVRDFSGTCIVRGNQFHGASTPGPAIDIRFAVGAGDSINGDTLIEGNVVRDIGGSPLRVHRCERTRIWGNIGLDDEAWP
jgi:hypothetical protein